MCNVSGISFGTKNLVSMEITGKKVIEVGSYDVNGSLRSFIESLDPAEYIGVDIEEGPGVDIVCNAEDIVEIFGEESFDVVISTELMEHVKEWRRVISNLKKVCKNDGIIILTTRSYGFPYHGYPHDYWRFELDDIKNVFSDFDIISLENDYLEPGIFLKARKPTNFTENNLSTYKLYNIVKNKRSTNIDDKDLKSLYFKRLVLKESLNNFLLKIRGYLYYKLFSKND